MQQQQGYMERIQQRDIRYFVFNNENKSQNINDNGNNNKNNNGVITYNNFR